MCLLTVQEGELYWGKGENINYLQKKGSPWLKDLDNLGDDGVVLTSIRFYIKTTEEITSQVNIDFLEDPDNIVNLTPDKDGKYLISEAELSGKTKFELRYISNFAGTTELTNLKVLYKENTT